MRYDTLRARAGAWFLLMATMCAVTACGSVAATGGTSGSPPVSASGNGAAATAKAAKVSLNITVTRRPGAKPEVWTLRCLPAGGTHPDPAATCRILLHAKGPFAALPIGMMCPMAGIGADTGTIRGTWFGQRVDRVIVPGGCGLIGRKIGPIFN
jgi:Subtilisin inhibitor-like